MRCPNCGSEQVTVINNTDTKGYGFCKGIFGVICLGPIGLICGLCGMGKSTTKTYIYCSNCRTKSRID